MKRQNKQQDIEQAPFKRIETQQGIGVWHFRALGKKVLGQDHPFVRFDAGGRAWCVGARRAVPTNSNSYFHFFSNGPKKQTNSKQELI